MSNIFRTRARMWKTPVFLHVIDSVLGLHDCAADVRVVVFAEVSSHPV